MSYPSGATLAGSWSVLIMLWEAGRANLAPCHFKFQGEINAKTNFMLFVYFHFCGYRQWFEQQTRSAGDRRENEVPGRQFEG